MTTNNKQGGLKWQFLNTCLSPFPSPFPINFKNDGTFVVNEAGVKDAKEHWDQIEGDWIIFIYSSNPGTTYAGTRVGGSMLGMMTWPGNSNGYWYTVKLVTTKDTKEKPRDITGKIKQ